MIIPPGGQTPPDEPTRLPCSNPVDCAEADEMIARCRGPEWHYVGWCMSTLHPPDATRTINGYHQDHYNAWKHGVEGAWPPPGPAPGFSNPGNWHTIISKPV